MMTSKWIDGWDLKVGDVGFLVETSNGLTGLERYTLCDRPPYTNQSLQPRLYGWCGSYNDTSTTGHGMAIVVRVAKNGRAFVHSLEGDALAKALEDLGYPELMPKTEEA